MKAVLLSIMILIGGYLEHSKELIHGSWKCTESTFTEKDQIIYTFEPDNSFKLCTGGYSEITDTIIMTYFGKYTLIDQNKLTLIYDDGDIETYHIDLKQDTMTMFSSGKDLQFVRLK